jgi:hypothetical protein
VAGFETQAGVAVQPAHPFELHLPEYLKGRRAPGSSPDAPRTYEDMEQYDCELLGDRCMRAYVYRDWLRKCKKTTADPMPDGGYGRAVDAHFAALPNWKGGEAYNKAGALELRSLCVLCCAFSGCLQLADVFFVLQHRAKQPERDGADAALCGT